MSDTNKWLNTKEWLNAMLIINNNNEYFVRNGIKYKELAAFKQCGCIFGIYQSENHYCAHSSDTWDENEQPNMGYYDKSLTYEQVIENVANTYDKIREKSRIEYNTLTMTK